MEFNFKYSGQSAVAHHPGQTSMHFVPDAFREPTFFRGLLNRKIPFREAISALHHIVVSDFRYQPKDRAAYLEWAKSQEDIWLAEAMAGSEVIKEALDLKKYELQQINQEAHKILAPYYDARNKYFKHLYLRDRDVWMVLDPVISVHPDELFFECFSKDESSYGKLSCNYNVFKNVDEFACGTTNIDYSVPLYNEFQKVRTYKDTEFVIDPSGFEVTTTNEDQFKEVKIDLPDSWVRGFLQVSSAMTMRSFQFDLQPIDLMNLIFFLRRNKEKHGPRSIIWVLKKDAPIKIIIEPWDKEIICSRSIYKGSEEGEVRMWGRRRLALLERLISVTKSVKVTLLGTGLPSFFEMNLGDMIFTLGLSGWTDNDWSRSSNFDLMTPRYETDGLEQQKVFLALKENWFESAQSLATRLEMSVSVVESALTNFIQEGKVVFDLHNGVYRVRELSKEPLPMDQLRYKNEREEAAAKIVAQKKLIEHSYEITEDAIKHRGVVTGNQSLKVEITISDDERLVAGKCSCRFYRQNKMYKGPCAHMMALRKIGTTRIDRILTE